MTKDKLEQYFRSNFLELEDIQILEDADVDNALYAVVLVKDKSVDRLVLCKRMIQRASSQGHFIVPVIYTHDEWNILQGSFLGDQRQEMFSRTFLSKDLLAAYQQKPNFPKNLRRFLRKAIKEHLHFVDFLERTAQYPSYLCIAFCTTIMKEALGLLFASKGSVFSGNLMSIQFFEENFVQKEGFISEDISLFFWLCGLEKQTKHFWKITGDDGEAHFEWTAAVTDLSDFLKRFDKYVVRNFTSEKETQLETKAYFIGSITAIGIIVLGLIWYLITNIPLRPIADDAALKKKSGGIVGEYFQGDNFGKRVLRRTDNMINFSTGNTLDPKVSKDQFSVRWNGYLYFPKEGTKFLCIECDDGARLFFNKELLLEDWKKGSKRQSCEKIRVKQGWYPIKIEFFDWMSTAVLRFLWGENKDQLRPVSAEHLCCKEDGETDKKTVSKESIVPHSPFLPKQIVSPKIVKTE